MKTLAERLNHLMDEAGLRPADLVRATGARGSSVHAWLVGKTKNLKGENLVTLARLFNVSEAWLATGKGPKERTVSKAQMVTISQERYDLLTETQKRAIEEWVDSQITAYTGIESAPKSTTAA